jgi:hypothetical protein
MSFLILPVLVECGQLDDARERLKAVLKFHSTADKDTADMITHSFRYHNYMKSLELLEFSRKCQRSLTLNVAAVELPMVEVSELTTLADVEALRTYSMGYATGAAKPPAPARPSLSAEALAALSDNADYGLLVRCDVRTCELEAAVQGRRKDATLRAQASLSLLDLTQAFLQDDQPAANEAFLRVVGDEKTREELCAARAESSLGDIFKGGRAGTQWSQQTQQADDASASFSHTLVTTTFLQCTKALLDAWASRAGSADAYTPSDGAATEALRALMTSLASATNARPSSASADEPAPLTPQWLRAVSLFTRVTATLLPVFLLCVAQSSPTLRARLAPKAPKAPKKNKKKGLGDKAESLSSADATIQRIAQHLRDVLTALEAALSAEVVHLAPQEEGLAPSNFYVPYVQRLVSGLDYTLPDFAPAVSPVAAAAAAPPPSASVHVAQELARSHYFSCKKLLEVVKRKRESLQGLV